jgi:hypothetical protein
VQHVTIHPTLAFTMGDAKSGDFITGRYSGHNTKQTCCTCYCGYNQSDDTDHRCVFVEEDRINKTIIPADLFLPYCITPSKTQLGEVLAGKWYQDACKQCRDFLLPVMLRTD